MSDNIYLSNTTQPITTWSGSTTADTTSGSLYEYTTPEYSQPTVSIPTVWTEPILKNKKGGDENMRYLYEVILVNPKKDTFLSVQIIARSETSALMKAYDRTDMFDDIDFDDLKTSCRVLMEWKKKESLKKAIETIKKAVD